MKRTIAALILTAGILAGAPGIADASPGRHHGHCHSDEYDIDSGRDTVCRKRVSPDTRWR
jgi:hypothetical protein